MRSVRHEFKFPDINVSPPPPRPVVFASIHSSMLFNGHATYVDAMMIKVIYIRGEESECKLGRGE